MPIIFRATLRSINIQNTALEHVNKRCSISTSPLSDQMKKQKNWNDQAESNRATFVYIAVCWLCIVNTVCVRENHSENKASQRETQGRDDIEQRNIDKHFSLVHEIFI